MIVGVLLAAGSGSRFGGGKLLAPLSGGTPVGVRSARTLVGAVDRALAVVRPEDAVLARLLAEEGLDVKAFPGSAEGMGASLAFGVAAAPEADGWLVALADMPFVLPETSVAVAERIRAGALLAAPAFRGRRGHPVGFGRGLFAELTAVAGDRGARDILGRHTEELRLVDRDDPGILMDIDELQDIQRLQDGMAKKLS